VENSDRQPRHLDVGNKVIALDVDLARTLDALYSSLRERPGR
jgi:hypothetical protein